jgi:transglutaminase-like putative cysteine protease
VLAERVEIKVPGGRAIKVKGPPATQTIATDADSRIYTWTYSRLLNTKDPGSDQKKQTEIALGRLSPPDVQISSFESWEDVGRWYWNLQKERIEPTPAIRAKAAELTKGMTDDAAKLQALYGFVSTQYRYIGIAFGIGRYQPHAADDVLTNTYGDCKDKHRLLAIPMFRHPRNSTTLSAICHRAKTKTLSGSIPRLRLLPLAIFSSVCVKNRRWLCRETSQYGW